MSQIQSPTIQAIGAESVEFINADSATVVSDGNSETVNIVAPAGYIYEVLGFRFDALKFGSGTHRLTVQSESEDIAILIATSTHAEDIEFNYSSMYQCNGVMVPNTLFSIQQQMCMKGLRFDSTNGLDIIYDNDLGGDTSTTRIIRLWVRKIKVG